MQKAFSLLSLVFVLAVFISCTQSRRQNPYECEGPDCQTNDADLPDVDVDGQPELCFMASIRRPTQNVVDMLFVVDNSTSMGEEQDALTAQFMGMAQELINPSMGDFPAVDDLHIGIVTTDMGTAGFSVQTCSEPMHGDNGILQNVGQFHGCSERYSSDDCYRETCPWLDHSTDIPDDGTDPFNPPVWEDFACVASVGLDGCGLEQPLEASLVALTEQSAPGRPNEGFIRDDSIVVVVYVTDEDDCSSGNAEMFNPHSDLGTLNIRCALHPDQLYPVERYYDGLRGLRPGREDMVIFSAIVGVPVDGSWEVGDPIEILEKMQEVDPYNPNQLIPSCDTAMGAALPPVRFAELAYMFGPNGTLNSICRQDWSATFEGITHAIQSRLTGSCLLHDVRGLDPWSENCVMIETLSDDRPCPHLTDRTNRTEGWQIDLGLNHDNRRLCHVLTADENNDGQPDEGIEGWYYTPHAPPCSFGRISLTNLEIMEDDSTIIFSCFSDECG